MRTTMLGLSGIGGPESHGSTRTGAGGVEGCGERGRVSPQAALLIAPIREPISGLDPLRLYSIDLAVCDGHYPRGSA